MKASMLVLFFLPFMIKAQEATGIKFENVPGWEQVLSKAKADNKYIFVDAYATWCGPCKKMDQITYSDSKVGDFYNMNFISVKVQMDTSKADGEQIRKWYADAKSLRISHQVSAYPAYLFFSPNGELVHRDLGYKNAADFIALGSIAINPKDNYPLKVAKWRSGGMNDGKILDLYYLAITMKDKLLADSVAKQYIGLLDKSTPKEILQKENLEFVGRNAALIRSHGNIFKTALQESKMVDSVLKIQGWSNLLINAVIVKEELAEKLWDNKLPRTSDPDWEKLLTTIKLKYPKADAGDIIAKYKLRFYEKTRNWRVYAALVDEDITLNPPSLKIKSSDVFYRLNDRAWKIFLNCDDSTVLKKALKWSDLSIKLEPSSSGHIQYLDTRANILYKLGRVKEAIAQEEAAIKTAIQLTDRNYPVLMSTLKKMRNNEPTWNVKVSE